MKIPLARLLALVGLVAFVVGFARGRSALAAAPAKQTVKPPAPDRWRCEYDAPIHIVERNPGAAGVDITYENNFVAAETIPKVASAEPATIATAHGPCSASILIFQGRVPARDGDPLPSSAQKDGLAFAPTILEAFSVEPTPTTAGGGTVQLEQAVVKGTEMFVHRDLGGGFIIEKTFQPAPDPSKKTGQRLPRFDFAATDKDGETPSVARFGPARREKSILVMMDGPGVAGIREGFEVGFPLVGPGQYSKHPWPLMIDDECETTVKLFTQISVDCSLARDGSGFTPFFGVKWGVSVLERVKDSAANTELVLLQRDTVRVSFPPDTYPAPDENPIGDARANGSMPRRMSREWSEVP